MDRFIKASATLSRVKPVLVAVNAITLAEVGTYNRGTYDEPDEVTYIKLYGNNCVLGYLLNSIKGESEVHYLERFYQKWNLK